MTNAPIQSVTPHASQSPDWWSGYPIEDVYRDDQAAIQSASAPVLFTCSDYAAPEEIDSRSWMVVENQGNVGSCQGQALSSAVEYAYKVKQGVDPASGNPLQFSRQFGYIGTQKIDGIVGDRGSTLSGGMRLVKEYGCARESVCPYPNRYVRNLTAAHYADAADYKIQSSTWLDTYAGIFDYLSAGLGAVEIGVIWDAYCRNCTGLLSQYSGQGRGGHAVLFCGYTARKDNSGRNWLLLLNSHSQRWGKNGWAEVAPSAVDSMCRSRFFSAMGLSDLTVDQLQPRKFWETHSIFGRKRTA